MLAAPMRARLLALTCVTLSALPGCARKPPPETKVTIAAASDLTAAFGELGEAFAKKTGVTPTFSFGSTGLLAKQLDQGAPFDVFAAASASYVEQVTAAGACDAASRSMYARGRLVLWWRKGAAVAPPTSLADLADPRFVHVSIANPEHAPYGRAAEDALEHAGALLTVKPKLVFGENVQQALQLAATGNADVAVVALSLAIRSDEGAYLAVDPSQHAPIDQAMVLCRHGRGGALGKQFTEFVASPEGRRIMRSYGFLLPGETLASAR